MQLSWSRCTCNAASERKVVATHTSVVGSIARNTSGGMYAYRSTKAAAIDGLTPACAGRFWQYDGTELPW